jgi:hypothetical protein
MKIFDLLKPFTFSDSKIIKNLKISTENVRYGNVSHHFVFPITFCLAGSKDNKGKTLFAPTPLHVHMWRLVHPLLRALFYCILCPHYSWIWYPMNFASFALVWSPQPKNRVVFTVRNFFLNYNVPQLDVHNSFKCPKSSLSPSLSPPRWAHRYGSTT